MHIPHSGPPDMLSDDGEIIPRPPGISPEQEEQYICDLIGSMFHECACHSDDEEVSNHWMAMALTNTGFMLQPGPMVLTLSEKCKAQGWSEEIIIKVAREEFYHGVMMEIAVSGVLPGNFRHVEADENGNINITIPGDPLANLEKEMGQ